MIGYPKTKEAAQQMLQFAYGTENPSKDLLESLTGCALFFGFFNEVLGYYQQIANTPDQSPETTFQAVHAAGAVLTGMREFDQAIGVMEEAGRLKPSSIDVLMSLNRLHRFCGRFDKAIEYAKRAYKRNPSNAVIFADVTRCFDLARRGHELAQSITPDQVPKDDQIACGSALYDIGAFDEAHSTLKGELSFLPPVALRQIIRPMEDLEKSFPAVSGSWPVNRSAPTYFAACDQGYFDTYAVKLSKSIARLQEPRALHLHVYSPEHSEEELAALIKEEAGLENLSVTTERAPEGDTTYFASIRFLRFAQLTQVLDAPAMCVDMDCLMRRDAFLPSSTDIVGFMRPEFAALNLRFSAQLLRVNPTQQAHRFLNVLTSFIVTAFHEGWAHWYVDQMALLLAHRLMVVEDQSVTYESVTHRQVQYQHYDQTALIWAGKGLSKELPDLPAE